MSLLVHDPRVVEYCYTVAHATVVHYHVLVDLCGRPNAMAVVRNGTKDTFRFSKYATTQVLSVFLGLLTAG